MKALREFLDQKVEPWFKKGSPLAMLHPMYEAPDTFLYTPGHVAKGSTHVRDNIDLKRMMIMVVVALIPCTLFAMWNTGYQANLAMAKMESAGYEILTPAEYELVPKTEIPLRKLAKTDWHYTIQSAIGLGRDPGSFVDNFVFGALHFLPIYIVCMFVGGHIEALFCVVRGHEINEGFLVTGLLFPLTLPPTIPLWQVAIGIAFGVIVGKEVFGGTGRNFLNPALTARAFLYFAYAGEISGDKVWTAVDGFSGATSLGAMASAVPGAGMAPVTGEFDAAGELVAGGIATSWGTQTLTWWDCFLGTIQGSMGETSALACLIGAAILIAAGIGSWRIMAGTVVGAVATAALMNAIGSDKYAMFEMPPMWHLVVGGFAFGAVFMATDPVSAAMTNTGRWIYGVLIGFMTILVRVVNPAYPEGIMLAILFANVFAPLIDYYVAQANIKRRVARYATS
ncbi:Na(+)-translocating NADH-quinone reductase subunit B [Rosistilla ulvae]|uniref:Na(+)-translocating NADH-quinone reductase subunit B n=1 Tax=Rosistilla ulvae TaxID=1930277 RepID=A0A517LZK5_9BACT|nr:NADH:ubiquinone reductase (Na(+)-transporting) subunit B [Rosistilla ulvae]QDS88052.1 Na(+)-translocating NADH-quinone reductase subunit B [Rosistilla ulvae]